MQEEEIAAVNRLREQAQAALAAGDCDRALELLEQAESRFRPPPPFPAALASEKADVLRLAGRLAEAEQAIEPAVALAQSGRLPPTLRVAILNTSGLIHQDAGRGEQAEAALREACRTCEVEPECRSLDLAVRGNLAQLYFRLGRGDMAIRTAQEALARARESGLSPLEIAGQLNALGMMHFHLGDTDSARPVFEEALAAYRGRGGRVRGLATSVNNLAATYHTTDPDKAMALYREAIEVASGVEGAEGERARALFNVGQLEADRGEGEAAWQHLTASLEYSRRVPGADLQTAVRLVTLAGLWEREGEYPKAREMVAEAIRLLRKRAPGSVQYAYAAAMAGKLSLAQGWGAAAVRWYQRAAGVLGELPEQGPHLLSVTRSLAAAAQRTGDFAAADRHLREALSLAGQLQLSPAEVADIRCELATCLREAGDLMASAAAHEEALRSVEGEVGREADAVRADAVGGLGLVARQRGRLGEAMRRLREATRRAQEGPSPRQHARWLIELAEVQALQGAEGAALQTHARVLELAAAEPGCLHERVRSLCAVGSLLAAQGRIEDAHEKLGEAAQLSRRAGMTAELALALNGKAEIMMGVGQAAPAAHALRQALEMNLRGGAPDSVIARNRNNLAAALLEAEDPEAVDHAGQAFLLQHAVAPYSVETAVAAANLGLALWQSGDSASAEVLLRTSVCLIEALRGSVEGPSLQQTMFSRFLPPYETLIAMLVEQGRTEEAFSLAQRCKARGLMEMQAEAEVGVWGPAAAANAEAFELAGELAEATAEAVVAARKGAGGLAAEAVARQRALQERLATHCMRGADGELLGEGALSVHQLQQALPTDWAALDYFIGETHSYLWAIHGGGVDCSRIELRESDLLRLVNAVRRRADYPSEHFASREALELEAWALGELWERLIGPVDWELAEAERLVIAPHGPLHYLPFEALRSPGDPFDCLGDTHIVQYAPSLAFWAARRSSTAPTRLGPHFFGLGPPVMPDPDREAELRLVFDPLPEAETEVRAILSLISGRDCTRESGDRIEVEEGVVCLGHEATWEALTEHGLGSQWLHFATHALPNARRPMDSALLVSPSQRGTCDGQLNAYVIRARDILRMRLSADMVVLSACSSGLGRRLRGEGIVGLSYAFLGGDVRTLVLSLWTVNDRCAAELMQEFYRLRLAGRDAATALAEAKRSLRRSSTDYRDLRHWAPFVVVGE